MLPTSRNNGTTAPRGPQRHRWKQQQKHYPPSCCCSIHAKIVTLCVVSIAMSIVGFVKFWNGNFGIIIKKQQLPQSSSSSSSSVIVDDMRVRIDDGFAYGDGYGDDDEIPQLSLQTQQQNLDHQHRQHQQDSSPRNHHTLLPPHLRGDHATSSLSSLSPPPQQLQQQQHPPPPPPPPPADDVEDVVDAIIVGTGLAGMVTALTVLDRGGKVILIEKEPLLGGNSKKASSGINACCLFNTSTRNSNNSNNNNNNNGEEYDNEESSNEIDYDDTIDSFRNDTIKSAGGMNVANYELIDTLVSGSAAAVTWLRHRVHVDLSKIVQLGGHSHKRTHRPNVGFVGAELMYAIEKEIKSYETTTSTSTSTSKGRRQAGVLKILVNTRVTKLIQIDEDQHHHGGGGRIRHQPKKTQRHRQKRVIGVECTTPQGVEPFSLYANNVILATGGFASDRSHGSYLEQYRPEYMNFPATAGTFSTGDGITLAAGLGAGTRDMEKIQLHPTGFINPNDRSNPNKVLAAELLRGVGGILLTKDTGQRFCNELGTRAYISDTMLSHNNPQYAQTHKWDSTTNSQLPTFYLVLSSKAAKEASKHVEIYTHKGLLTKVVGVDALATFMNLPKESLISTLRSYHDAATRGMDEFEKTVFRNVPPPPVADTDLSSKEEFAVGEVSPVLHYCMGGLVIDKEGSVLQQSTGEPILGLHAAGEVTGGVHGKNRLGGNSLLECAVFGTIIGQKISITNPVIDEDRHDGTTKFAPTTNAFDQYKHDHQKLREITLDELYNSAHDTGNDSNTDHNKIFVAIHGIVYDLTHFANKHPGGAETINRLGGTDATKVFSAMHSGKMLEQVEGHIVGRLVETTETNPKKNVVESANKSITIQELKKHNTPNDLWMAVDGNVYNLTDFRLVHPGGSHLIEKNAGKDATTLFHMFHHHPNIISLVEDSIVGKLVGDEAQSSVAIN